MALKNIRQQYEELEKRRPGLNVVGLFRKYADKYIRGIDFNPDLSRVAKMNMVLNDDGKNNINDLIKEAIALETTGKIGFYYLDKKRTQIIFKKSGYQLPRALNNLSFDTVIRSIDNNVNKKINKIMQSKQFIR